MMGPRIRDVLIVGGGPVGLMLGCWLARSGLAFEIIEAVPTRQAGSRAIGIHPPSLEHITRLGMLQDFLREGVQVERARVCTSRSTLGVVELERRGGAFPFPLSLPQERTEWLLERHLESVRPGCLQRGVTALRVDAEDGAASVLCRSANDEQRQLLARHVVGCDGHHSAVRQSMGVALSGYERPERYWMGDFDDDTDLGSDAAFFLADDGLVESFPLPYGRRRWVVQAPGHHDRPRADEIATVVGARTRRRIHPATATMVSAFGVEQRRAERLVDGPRLLAGDAAHVISPFGGQGMNVGWRDAWDLAQCLRRIASGANPVHELSGYERRSRAAARLAMRKAALSGWIGRRNAHPRLRNALVGAFIGALPESAVARFFTMGPAWPAPVRKLPRVLRSYEAAA